MKRIVGVAVVSLVGIATVIFFMRQLGSGYFFDKVLPSLIGTGIGALLAFQVKRLQDAKEDQKRKKAAGNLALFTLVQQVNDLLQTEVALAQWRPDTAKSRRWIEMKAVHGFSELPSIHVEDLGWLLETEDRNLLGRLMAARNGYLTVMGLLALRKQIKGKVDDHLEKEIQKEGAKFPDGLISEDFLLAHLTSRQIVELNQSAETLLDMSSDVFHDQYEVMEDMHRALKKIWPRSIFIKLEPKEELLKRSNLELPPPSKTLAAIQAADNKSPTVHRIEIN